MIQRHTDLTQTQLGQLVGLGQSQISEIISGVRRVSTVEVLARIATGLGMPEPARSTLFFGGAHSRTSAGYCDVRAIYPTRSQFIADMPPNQLFDNASSIRALGLSLNLITFVRHL